MRSAPLAFALDPQSVGRPFETSPGSLITAKSGARPPRRAPIRRDDQGTFVTMPLSRAA
jgi:hypothetical protein